MARDGNGYQDNEEKEKSLWAKENVKCEKCESHVKEAQFDSKMSHQIKRERESFEYIQSYDDYGKYDDYGDYGNDYGNDYGEDYGDEYEEKPLKPSKKIKKEKKKKGVLKKKKKKKKKKKS